MGQIEHTCVFSRMWQDQVQLPCMTVRIRSRVVEAYEPALLEILQDRPVEVLKSFSIQIIFVTVVSVLPYHYKRKTCIVNNEIQISPP
jgi:hypothetical protein